MDSSFSMWIGFKEPPSGCILSILLSHTCYMPVMIGHKFPYALFFFLLCLAFRCCYNRHALNCLCSSATVAVTQILWRPRGLLVDQFDSKEDLINAVVTSSFIPG